MHQPQPPKPLDLDLLATVTGGAQKVTRHVNDPSVTDAITQLKTDVEGLVTSAKNTAGGSSSSMSSMLPMMMMMMGRS